MADRIVSKRQQDIFMSEIYCRVHSSSFEGKTSGIGNCWTGKTTREEEVEYTQAHTEGPTQAGRGEIDCRMDCSTKDVNGLFHKRCKWIDPQNQKMDRSTKIKNGSSHKNKEKKSFHRETNGKVRWWIMRTEKFVAKRKYTDSESFYFLNKA
jgi:hypothetical protein